MVPLNGFNPIVMTISEPPMAMVKINSDATTCIQRNFGTIAAIARDDNGGPFGWSRKKIKGITDPLILECIACREATILAKLQNMVEEDSQVVINSISGALIPQSRVTK
ncbi:hypothetical protein GH714_038570 [Hevea brasiliensis]|uniref:RNase H type-1 domain-containing protein n=1 Tax=Hevea brasiliensis TaxID=3981 RepID=A0A6A6NAQ6_HEVBR|nr:hypothetical protein GH714_038570 [Hevea brasiliensis]